MKKHSETPGPPRRASDDDDESYGFAMLIGFSGDDDLGGEDAGAMYDAWDEGLY